MTTRFHYVMLNKAKGSLREFVSSRGEKSLTRGGVSYDVHLTSILRLLRTNSCRLPLALATYKPETPEVNDRLPRGTCTPLGPGSRHIDLQLIFFTPILLPQHPPGFTFQLVTFRAPLLVFTTIFTLIYFISIFMEDNIFTYLLSYL